MIKLKLKPEPKVELDTQFIDKERLVEVGSGSINIGGISMGITPFIEKRGVGEFAGYALFLPSKYDYALGVDGDGSKILIPLKPVT